MGPTQQRCLGLLLHIGREAAGTHFKVSSIIHGELEELPACCEPLCSHTLQKGCLQLWP